MKIAQFREDARRVAKHLLIAEENVDKTLEVLRRLLRTDEVEVSSWAVRNGKIFVTFGSCVVLDGVINHTVALSALFPGCRFSERQIEIESTELL